MAKINKKNIIVFVGTIRQSALDELRAYGKVTGQKFRIMLIWDSQYPLSKKQHGYDILLELDFSSSVKIYEALLPYQEELLAITCSADDNIARFAKIIPHVPYLRTPTTESITWATDKYEMRRRFRAYNPKMTPRFARISADTPDAAKRVIDKVGFPMIVKPTNLGASLFVQVCYHEEDLKKAMSTGFKKIRKAYEHDKRMEEPKMIAEQFMEGDLYSLDSYVNSRGDIEHTPLVRVKTGREIGRPDFYGYIQMTPTILKGETVHKAHRVAEDAIHALGLRSVTAHVELMKIDNDWKVIEVGPRLGGARDVIYKLSCDIEHSLNDILLRIPKKVKVPKKCKGSAVFMKWFAEKEGVITEMKGIKKIEQLESFYKININKKVGDKSVFASKGGRSVFNLFMYNPDRAKLLADIRRVEKMVEIKVQ